MYARVISMMIMPAHVDDVLAMMSETILPVVREQQGFVDAIGLIDRSTGRGMLMTLWEDAHCLESSEMSGYVSAQLVHAAPFLAGPAIRETFEVAVPPLAHAS